MPRVVVVLGLCGSGKSTLVERLATEGFQPFDEGVGPGLRNWEPFLEAVRAGADCVLVDVGYYLASNRAGLASVLAELAPGTVSEYRCFETDRATADENCRKDAAAGRRVQHRCDANLVHNAEMAAALDRGELSIPAGAEIMKIVPA